nr:glycosyltransferase [Pseudonocardia sp. KRD291]
MVSEHASPLAEPGGPDCGGQNVHVRELACALARAGHRVTVHTRRDDAALPEWVELRAGVRVHHLDAGPAVSLPKDDLIAHVPQMARELERAWRGDRPDVVHAHFWMSGQAALAAARGLDAALPVVQTFHALGAVKARHQGGADTSPAGRCAAEAHLARAVDRVIASCPDERDELSALGAPVSTLVTVPSGVDTGLFAPVGPVRRRGARPRVLTVGRLVRRKGVDETVEALAEVPGAELLVAGGPADPADEATDPDTCRLRAVVHHAGVADRVRFAGAVSRDRMPAMLRSADVVVCAPWYEPFGIVPLEAMSCGRPVVATAVGGLRETVVHGETGLHVAPRRADEIAAALRALLADPARRTAYGSAGRRRVLGAYSWDRVAESVTQVYEDAVRHRVRTPAVSAV